MAENKTKSTDASVEDHIAAIANEQQRKDCETLVALLGRITQEEPKMWGPTIVGFGSYHYKYASGHEGDYCVTGFAARKNDLSVHLLGKGQNQEALLAQLGKHKMGKSCLYIRKLSDVDLSVLEKLVQDSVAEIRRLYG